jgi:TusA-related sulfurtransferase
MVYFNLNNQHRPGFLVNTKRKTQSMEKGDLLIVQYDDPNAVEDIQKYCTISINHLVMVKANDDNIVFEIIKN